MKIKIYFMICVLFSVIFFIIINESGVFMTDEEFINSHPEIYREDGEWRSDWRDYLKNPEIYTGEFK